MADISVRFFSNSLRRTVEFKMFLPRQPIVDSEHRTDIVDHTGFGVVDEPMKLGRELVSKTAIRHLVSDLKAVTPIHPGIDTQPLTVFQHGPVIFLVSIDNRFPVCKGFFSAPHKSDPPDSYSIGWIALV